jgi:hypothetical protein
LRSAQANNSQDSISKISKEKWAEGVTQAVEHLFCQCKALSSNPSHTRKKKKNKSLLLGDFIHIYERETYMHIYERQTEFIHIRNLLTDLF